MRNSVGLDIHPSLIVLGHRDLYLDGETLHCDIDWTNILLGKPGALAGKRGILIDLDHAKPISLIIPQRQAIVRMTFSVSNDVLNLRDNDRVTACSSPSH